MHRGEPGGSLLLFFHPLYDKVGRAVADADDQVFSAARAPLDDRRTFRRRQAIPAFVRFACGLIATARNLADGNL